MSSVTTDNMCSYTSSLLVSLLGCRDGMVEVCKEEQSKSKLPVSTAADVWPDCLTTKLHPNTTMTLPGHWHNEYVI